MPFQGLRDYEGEFRAQDFADEKVLRVVECGPLKDYKTQQIIGTKVTTVIMEDHSTYAPKADGTPVSNKWEKLAIRVLDKTLNIPVDAEVKVIGAKARIWGDYRNNLSFTAEDVQVIKPAKP